MSEAPNASVAHGVFEGRTGVPAESTDVHTRILRCMLAADDSLAYWRHVDTGISTAERTRMAFERRWFGTKSEARVRTIMADMLARFDAYPEALALLHQVARVPAGLRVFVCHLHTQLADPVYRAFTGDFLPRRRDDGRTTIDRPTVARWVESCHPGRWSTVTCTKFASNLLATALDVGLVGGRRDPRRLVPPAVPALVVGYALYLVRSVRIEGSLTDNPYLRSLGITREALGGFGRRIPGIRVAELGGVAEITFEEPSLAHWGLRYLGEAS